jgi:hypothetical protein
MLPFVLQTEHVTLNSGFDGRPFEKPGTTALNKSHIAFGHGPGSALHLPLSVLLAPAAAGANPESPPK